MLSTELKNKILEKAIFLKEYDIKDPAWKKNDALDLLRSIKQSQDEIGILQGRLFEIKEDGQIYPIDCGWDCDMELGESKIEFYPRSQKMAFRYILSFRVYGDRNVLFALKFTDRIINGEI